MSVKKWWNDRQARIAADRERELAFNTYQELLKQPGANDPNAAAQHIKLLGVLMVENVKLGFDYSDGDVKWSRGDPAIDIIIPPIPKDMIGLESVRESHHMLAQYVGYNGLHAYTNLQAVGAVTNMRFARVAERFMGFNIAQVDPGVLPAEYVANAAGIYDDHAKQGSGKPFEPAFIYQTPEQLLLHYADADPELAALAYDPLPRKYDFFPGLE
jgi:hypothetical protein